MVQAWHDLINYTSSIKRRLSPVLVDRYLVTALPSLSSRLPHSTPVLDRSERGTSPAMLARSDRCEDFARRCIG